MVNLVRDNKVLTRKIFHNLKSWLNYTQFQIAGSCAICFWSSFCKINAVPQTYSYMYFKRIPDDSFVVIEDTNKDMVLIGIDFSTLLTRDNFVIGKASRASIQMDTNNMAKWYVKTALTRLKSRGSMYIYDDLVRELRDVFGYVVTGSISGDVYTDLLELLDSQTTFTTERDRLLDCIANYLEEQVDNAIDDLAHRMYISNAEIQGRNKVLVIANLDFKKNRFTMYNSLVSSAKWKILKGAKNNPMSFDLSELVNSKGNFKTRYIEVDFSFRNVDEYKNNTLYLI